MDRLAAFVALIALGGVAWLAFGQDTKPASTDVSEQVAELRAEQAALAERIEQLLAARPANLVSGNAGPAAADGGPVLHPHTGVAHAEEVPMHERVARLEAHIRKQDESMAELKKKGAGTPSRMHMSPFGGKRFLRSADDAADALEMSDAQKSDMERILDSAKHELERLYDTQNEDGETLSALQKKMGEEIKNRKGDQPFTNILSHVTAMAKFKQGKVPGSDETFAQAERRINKRAMADIRRGLTSDQQKKWDDSHTGGLLPGAGGSTTVSTVMVGEPASGVVFGGFEEER